MLKEKRTKTRIAALTKAQEYPGRARQKGIINEINGYCHYVGG